MAAWRWSPQRERLSLRRSWLIPALEILEDRITPNAGSLDPNFGVGGQVLTAFNSSVGNGANAVAMQADGKIVVAGLSYQNGIDKFAVARYTAAGALDTSFGTEGEILTPFPGANYPGSQANAVAVQSDGKIVVAGYAEQPNGPSGGNDIALARYTTTGQLDTSFGNGGLVVTAVSGYTFSQANALAIQSDGKIVVAGAVEDPRLLPLPQLAVVRYTATGALDGSFGSGGQVLASYPGTVNPGIAANAVAVQSDGGIVVAGSTSGLGVITRFTAAGVQDTTFGSGGWAVAPNDEFSSIALQGDGKIVVTGDTHGGYPIQFAVARYTAGGLPDASFGTGGLTLTSFPNSTGSESTTVAVQGDGEIVVGGLFRGIAPPPQPPNFDTEPPFDFALARYTTSGALDGSFGSGGLVVTAFNSSTDNRANALAIQSDGNIVVAGSSVQGTANDFAIARYMGTSGFEVTTLADSGPGSLRAEIAAVNSDPITNGADQITFASSIQTQTVVLQSPLPALTRDQVTITGPISVFGTNPVSGATVAGDGLDILGNNDSVQQVVFEEFNGDGIALFGNDDTLTGDTLTLNTGNGIRVSAADGGGMGATIGGTSSGSGNVITSNTGNGIDLDGAQNATIQGNWIGTDSAGDAGKSNTGDGIHIENAADNNSIGGTVSGAANTIADNQGNGVTVLAGTGNAIREDIIYGNMGLPIQLGGNGFAPNSAGSPHTGPNDYQNYPIITSGTGTSGTTLQGYLNSAPNATFNIDVYEFWKEIDPTNGNIVYQNAFFLGTVTVMTDGGGNISFTPPSPVTVQLINNNDKYEEAFAGTATDQTGNTSEMGLALTPAQIRTAYGLNLVPLDGAGQTIAIVDAYDDPTIASDLDTFDRQFGTTLSGLSLYSQYGPASKFLSVLNQNGLQSPLPGPDPDKSPSDWEGEEALDVEWAHAFAPAAKIDLIECASGQADQQGLADLMAGARVAGSLPGVSVVSMSWGFLEGNTAPFQVTSAEEGILDASLITPGVTYLAATGDNGSLAKGYPAFSPNVLAVGGTTLLLNGDGSYNSEVGWGYNVPGVGWIGSGGGASQFESQPPYQASIVPPAMSNHQGVADRTIPDVSMIGGTTVAVIDSYIPSPTYAYPANPGWLATTGTSLSTPCWAGLIALADEGRANAKKPILASSGPAYQTQTALYDLPSGDFNDITTGNNGYQAGPGYDLVTGLGTPVASRLVAGLISYGATSIALSSSANPSVSGQLLNFTATVSASAPGALTPTGTVRFYDGALFIGSGTLSKVNGVDQATFSTAGLSVATHSITAVYGGDQNFLTSVSVPLTQTVTTITSSALQAVVAEAVQLGIPVTIEADPTEPDSLATILTAVNGLQAPTASATLTVSLEGGNYTDQTVSAPSNLVLVIQDGTLVGSSPAFTLNSGQVELLNCTLTTATNAPTILVAGGNLSLRGTTVEESTGFTDAAIDLTSGTLDLGTSYSSGGNVLNVNGDGEFVHNSAGNPVSAFGDTFEVNGTALTAPYLSFTTLTSSSSSSVFGQSVTFTATTVPNTAPGLGSPSGSVVFFDITTDTPLGSVPLSGWSATLTTAALGVGQHIILATYGGDSNFCLSLDSVAARWIGQSIKLQCVGA
jgi:uncharacterized delta-60 repeat protein